MQNIIYTAITMVIMIAAFLGGKYVFPNIPKSVTDKLDDLAAWATKFVVWAREFMKASTGEEKMAEVVKQLQQIAKEAGLDVTEDQLKAIAQAAYEAMKAGEAAAATQNTTDPAEGAAASQTAPNTTVIVNTAPAAAQTVAVATDNVPEGALDDNPDSTVNAYNDTGEKIGTIPKTVAEAAAANVEVIITEQAPADAMDVAVDVSAEDAQE